MVILCVPAAGNAAGGARNSELTIELGQSPDMSGISVWVGDGKTEPEIIKQDDKTAWHIGSTVWSDENLYLNINDAIAQIFKEYEDIYLDIEYYDEKPSGVDASFFEIRYIDAGGAQARSETVWGGGTERFVTATVKLTAAQLNNSFNGSDFVLTTRSFLYGYSGKGVKISKITLRPSDTQSFVTARITTDKTGNIMYDTDKAKTFKCSVLNRSDAETEVGCTLRVLDDTGSVIETQEKAVIAQKGETAFYLDYQARRYGTFTAELTVENGNNTYTAKCPFSYNKYADGLNDRIGACVHLGYSSRDPIKTLELVSNAGIGWIRTEMHWKFYETEKGVYKLSAHQKNCLENARKNNLKLLVILAFGNSLYMENQDTSLPKTTAEKEAFYNYVYNLVTELERDYGDVVGAYELWNEPNMLSFNNDSADYVDLARYTRAAMTAAGSDKKLLGLSMTGLHSAEYCQWCTDAYDQGLGKYVDGITCHPYMEDRSPELYDLNAHIDIMHRLAKSHGASPEVWASEHGWVTTAYYGETMQAKYLVRSFLTAMSDSEFGNYFIYQFQDDGNNPYDKERQFGLLRTWSEAVVSYAAKKSYTAIANMNYQLKDLECVKHTEGAAYDSFRFEREDGNAYTEVVYNRYEADALYSPKKPKQGYSLTVYDMYGNHIETIHGDNGIYTFTLTKEPIYIKGNMGAFEKAGNVISVEYPSYGAMAGREITIPFTDSLGRDLEIAADLSVGGFELVENNGIINGSGSVRLKSTGADGEYNVRFVLYDGETAVGTLLSKITVGKPVEIEIADFEQASAIDDSHWKSVIKIKNTTNFDTISGVCEPAEGEDPGAGVYAVKFFDLKPGEEQTLYMNLPPMEKKRNVDIEYKVTLDNEKEYYVKGTTNFQTASYAYNKPTIDGTVNLSEWTGAWVTADQPENAYSLVNGTTWGGKEDVSFDLNTMWDEENLYMAFIVEDNVFCNNEPIETMWAGDCVQFGIEDIIGTGKYIVDNVDRITTFVEMAFALLPSGPAIYRYSVIDPAIPVGPVDMSKCKLAVTRDENLTFYEIEIPWAEIYGRSQ